MRTPRIVILSAFSLAFFTLLFLSARTPSQPQPITTTYTQAPKTKTSHGLFGTFSFTAPLSLFPPNAIISLTDDNTTAFHARPAAFGPSLPKNGMSGQLWIGSGFGDERMGNAGAELGCSDLPNWSDGHKTVVPPLTAAEGKEAKDGKNKHSKRVQPEADAVGGLGAGIGGKGDGTDDYLHTPALAPGADLSGAAKTRILDNPGYTHADIQSLQESAEIAGKVVLLQRGGCGFLEKVLWAQRRGGIAVIVGDDIPNRPLIQMYARGDTSNVTVPSVFTSRNTARMLSSLYGEGMDGSSGEKPKKGKAKEAVPKKTAQPVVERGTWLGRLLSGGKADSGSDADGNDDSSDQMGGSASVKAVKNPPVANSKASKPKAGSNKPATNDDGFVIGVQDWRDPDVLNKPVEGPLTGTKKAAPQPKKGAAAPDKAVPATDTNPKHAQPAKGGAKAAVANPPNAAAAVPAHADPKKQSGKVPSGEEKPGILTKIFGDDRDISDVHTSNGDGTDEDDDPSDPTQPGMPPHEGVWVTLTQTNGATPFFDTLLVLVVSPLVTLTVVYAMLLIRSRIRRRRWRAPKSVVQQLPVRTFVARDARQDSNASGGSGGGAARSTSPLPGSEATPLLGGRSRPRSRTTSGLPEPGISRSNSSTGLLDEPKPAHAQKDGATKAKGSQWKKYMGRQVECVVCLEEYVDGVSRVMSLPCGHEFHVECITPWLTTRRRTCPICKGDVVRSLQRANNSGSTSPRYIPYSEDQSGGEDDEQEQAVMTRNESPSADRPVSPGGDEDVEQGVREASPRENRRQRRGDNSGSWIQNLTDRIGLTSSSPVPEVDRRRD